MYALLEQICKYSNVERREFILDYLSSLRVSPVVHKFTSCGEKYANIFAIYGQRTGKPVQAVSSHYDKTERGQGALDDGAAVVELLGVVKHLIKNDISAKFGFAFFDGEEEHCLGSKRFVREKPVNFSKVYNLEVTGNGNCIMIGKSSLGVFEDRPYSYWDKPISYWDKPIDNNPVMNKHLKRICDSMKIRYFEARTPPADNYYLNKAGIPSTVISTLSYKVGKIWQSAGEPTTQVMKLLGIHGRDSIKKIDKKTLTLMKKLILKIVLK